MDWLQYIIVNKPQEIREHLRIKYGIANLQDSMLYEVSQNIMRRGSDKDIAGFIALHPDKKMLQDTCRCNASYLNANGTRCAEVLQEIAELDKLLSGGIVATSGDTVMGSTNLANLEKRREMLLAELQNLNCKPSGKKTVFRIPKLQEVKNWDKTTIIYTAIATIIVTGIVRATFN